MEFFRLLNKEAEGKAVQLTVIAFFSGVINAALMSVIIHSAQMVSPGRMNFLQLALFAVCLSGFGYSRYFTLTETARLTENIIRQIRLRIVDKIRRAGLLLYESVGKEEIYTNLTKNTYTLSDSAITVASAFSSGIMLLFSTLYIATLSKAAFVMTLACMGLALAIYRVRRKTIGAQIQEATDKESEFFNLLNHLLDGFKQVKMHQPRNEDLYQNYIARSAESARIIKTETGRQFAQITIFSHLFFYSLIAVIIFVLPSFADGDAQKVGQITAVILFIIGPLTEVVGMAPAIANCEVAIHNIQQLESKLEDTEPPAPILDVHTHRPSRVFERITCENLSFVYRDPQGAEAFRVGPLDLTIRSGDLLFIVGGNGSGKSTLLKTLVGLYPHHTGDIRIDDRPVTTVNLARYRSLFSTVFTDFHLFDRLYGLPDPGREHIDSLLEEMELTDKTDLDENRFTTINLSTGQRKRLALIVALLEERPIMIFDEVAADQDPHFRRYLYRVLFPKLQRDGKTIVAVTHDDAYFDVADRVLKMEYGNLSEFVSP